MKIIQEGLTSDANAKQIELADYKNKELKCKWHY